MKRIINLCWVLLAVFQVSCKQEFKQPNVIIVITDDQGYGDIAAHGNTEVNTPNIDKLHGESVRLTNFHVSPTCAPTRGALMTGRFSNRVGVWHTVMGRSLLYENEKTMADVFAENNYKTAMFGKWHLGDNYPYAPHDRGFQEALFHGGGGVGQTPDYWNNDYFDDTYFRNGKEEKVKGYCTDVWFGEAMKFIEKNKENPFFCYISTNAPHGPLNVPSEYVKPYLDKGVNKTRAKFYGMITNADDNLGLLRNKLTELGIADNTILVFMTDNGTAYGAGFKGKELKSGYNAGMRGKKGSAYDGGHRVPFYVRWVNGGMDKGKDVNALTGHIDILPTLMNLCRIDTKEEIAFDGMDITPYLKGGRVKGDRVLITDSQRLELPVKWRQSSVMTQKWRMINGKELYDMDSDPEQQTDVASAHPEVIEKLRASYETWWDSQKDVFAKFPYIKVGAEEEKISCLTAHDWHEAPERGIPWNQQLIRKSTVANGEWRIDVQKEGQYKIVLNRWPKESGLGILDEAEKLVTDMPDYVLAKGKSFPFKQAKVKVGDKEWGKAIKEGDKTVDFVVELPKGETTMQTWLEGDDVSVGAYYVYVEKMDNEKVAVK